jgi:hypothetical protein
LNLNQLILFILDNVQQLKYVAQRLYTNVYKPIESILGQPKPFLQHVVILGCISSFGFADEVLERSVLISCIILTH